MVASIRPDLHSYIGSTISGPIAWLVAMALVGLLIVYLKFGEPKGK